jgi:hypothetical protein
MADRQEIDTMADPQWSISRRKFIQGVIATGASVSAVAAMGNSPDTTKAATLPTATATSVLTAEERSILERVLNRIIPSCGAMPGAGDCGVATFIDEVLAEAPHLKSSITGLLAEVQAQGGARLAEADVDRLLLRISHDQQESFHVLLQATYTGYYGHPQVLAALGAPGDGSDFEFVDATLLEDAQKRGAIFRQT